MSIDLGGAMALALSLSARPMTLQRPSEEAWNPEEILVSTSNYARNLSTLEETTVEGKEFVISKQTLDNTNHFTTIKKGDLLVDPDLGDMSIHQIIPMVGIGGEILAYRVRIA